MRHDLVFYGGVVWLAALVAVCAVLVARARTVSSRIVALDLLVLVLIGLLALVAGATGRSYPLDAALALALLSFVATLAAARYHGDGRPFT
jgi:multicomponent Na+:H+ antiporter subunit F